MPPITFNAVGDIIALVQLGLDFVGFLKDTRDAKADHRELSTQITAIDELLKAIQGQPAFGEDIIVSQALSSACKEVADALAVLAGFGFNALKRTGNGCQRFIRSCRDKLSEPAWALRGGARTREKLANLSAKLQVLNTALLVASNANTRQQIQRVHHRFDAVAVDVRGMRADIAASASVSETLSGAVSRLEAISMDTAHGVHAVAIDVQAMKADIGVTASVAGKLPDAVSCLETISTTTAESHEMAAAAYHSQCASNYDLQQFITHTVTNPFRQPETSDDVRIMLQELRSLHEKIDGMAARQKKTDVQPTSVTALSQSKRSARQHSKANDLMYGDGAGFNNEMFREEPAPLSSVAFVLHPYGGGKAYVFCGDRCACIVVRPGTTDDTLEWGPSNTATKWPSLSKAGFAGAIDAVLPRPDSTGDMYFFSAREYALVRSKPTADDYLINGPRSIVDGWPSLRKAGFRTVDAVLANPGNPKHEAYFFSGTQYVLIYYIPGTLDDYIITGPKDIQSYWPSLKLAGFPAVDTILPNPSNSGQAYFFYRGRYALIEIKPGTMDDYIITGPKPVHSYWPSLVKAAFW